jgi:hypothetical protein
MHDGRKLLGLDHRRRNRQPRGALLPGRPRELDERPVWSLPARRAADAPHRHHRTSRVAHGSRQCAPQGSHGALSRDRSRAPRPAPDAADSLLARVCFGSPGISLSERGAGRQFERKTSADSNRSSDAMLVPTRAVSSHRRVIVIVRSNEQRAASRRTGWRAPRSSRGTLGGAGWRVVGRVGRAPWRLCVNARAGNERHRLVTNRAWRVTAMCCALHAHAHAVGVVHPGVALDLSLSYQRVFEALPPLTSGSHLPAGPRWDSPFSLPLGTSPLGGEVFLQCFPDGPVDLWRRLPRHRGSGMGT